MKHILFFSATLSLLLGCSTASNTGVMPPNSESTDPINASKCIPEQAEKLVGQSELSDSQIKQLTKSQSVRRVQPNQPVTMDYREDRITVTIDPQSKKITHASCG